MFKRERAFTLIELMVVIAIIGVLVTLGFYSWSQAAARQRDNVRKTDLARIKSVLGQYYTDHRSYPTFTANYGPIYAADWQLTGSDCHPLNDRQRLTLKYFAELPRDPKQSLKLTDQNCNDPIWGKGQANRYLYLSGPSDNTGPLAPATSFVLLATMEKISLADPDLLKDIDNPLKTAGAAKMGPWYANHSNYQIPINVNANYLVTGVGL